MIGDTKTFDGKEYEEVNKFKWTYFSYNKIEHWIVNNNGIGKMKYYIEKMKKKPEPLTNGEIDYLKRLVKQDFKYSPKINGKLEELKKLEAQK